MRFTAAILSVLAVCPLAYCAVLAKQSLPAATRSERLGNFSVLLYGQLRDPPRG
jgi:hypothetical protein